MWFKFNLCRNLRGAYQHVEGDASFAVFKMANVLHIFFEESNGKIDWRVNFQFLAIPTKPYKDMAKGQGWMCHRGFLKNWKTIEKYIKDKIMDPEITEIDIVGYSHGGAIAQLCYEYVKYNRPDVEVSGVGFGAPRVYWGKLREDVKKRFEGFIIVRNGSDAVTHVPPKFLGYKHICEIMEVGEHFGLNELEKAIEEKGLKQAWKDGDFFGSIRDHFPDRYEAALDELRPKDLEDSEVS